MSHISSRARGFSIVELMVAIAVSVFLMAGLFTVLQNTHKSSDNERLMAQLQDNERVAMTLVGSVVESAGYYSNALSTGLTTALPASANFATDGQAVVGGTNAYGDTVTIRFQANKADGVLNCQGTVGNDGLYENKFYVDKDVDGQLKLFCSINGAAGVPLVSGGINKLSVAYGVGSAAPAANTLGAVDTYLPAAKMTAMYWTNVYTIRVTLTFDNPMKNQPGQAAKQTLTFERVMTLRSRTGVNISSYI